LNKRPQSEVLDHVESLDDDDDVLALIHAPVIAHQYRYQQQRERPADRSGSSGAQPAARNGELFFLRLPGMRISWLQDQRPCL
jgi:hypothetical protein